MSAANDLPLALTAITCPRWRAAAADLWRRLPAHDRATLAARLAGVTVSERMVLQLGSAATPETTAAGLRWRIEVARADWVGSADDLAALLAHEAAHICLKHGEVLALVARAAFAGAYTADDITVLNAVHELQAWAQVQLWGLGAEARGLTRRHPGVKLPAFWGGRADPL